MRQHHSDKRQRSHILFVHFVWASIIASLSSIISVAIWGFRFGFSNNEFHAVIVYKIAEGVRFPGDAMAGTIENFVSPFWWMIGYLSKFISPYVMFFLFFLLSRFFLNIGIGLIILAFSSSKKNCFPWIFAGCITLTSGFIRGLPLGYDPVIGIYLSQTFFSIGLCLISLALTFWGKMYWSAGLLGLTYNINSMQANFVFGILIFLWLAYYSQDIRKNILPLMKAIIITIFLGLPTFLWIVSIFRNGSGDGMLSGSMLSDFAKYYFPDHWFWSLKSSWEKSQGIFLLSIPFLLALMNKLSYKMNVTCIRQKESVIMAVILVGYTIAGIVSMEYFPSQFFLQLHLFRSDVITFTITIAFLGIMLENSIQYKNYTLSPIIFVVILLVTLHSFKLAAGILILTCCFMGIWQFEQFSVIRKIFRICLIMLLLAFVYKKNIEGIFVLLPLVCFGISEKQFHGIIRIVIIIPTALYFLYVNVQYHQRRNDTSEFALNQEQINQIASLAAKRTPSDALFLIPPIYNCRTYLHRGVYLTMKDGAAYLWQPGFEQEFLRRLQVLGIVYTPGTRFQNNQVNQEFEENLPSSLTKAKLEGVSHVILPKRLVFKDTAEILLENKDFCVLTIDNALKIIQKQSS